MPILWVPGEDARGGGSLGVSDSLQPGSIKQALEPAALSQWPVRYQPLPRPLATESPWQLGPQVNYTRVTAWETLTCSIKAIWPAQGNSQAPPCNIKLRSATQAAGQTHRRFQLPPSDVSFPQWDPRLQAPPRLPSAQINQGNQIKVSPQPPTLIEYLFRFICSSGHLFISLPGQDKYWLGIYMSGTGNEQINDPARSQEESASCKRERWQTAHHGAEWQVSGVLSVGENQGAPNPGNALGRRHCLQGVIMTCFLFS